MRAFLFGLPALVLVCAFGAICVHFRSAWPLNLPVHEDGQRTLWATLFYFEHAAGELPVDVLLSAAVAGAMVYCAGRGTPGARLTARLTALVLAVDGCILMGSVISAGPATTLRFLTQSHTRDGVPLAFGSHWGYHFLSEAALMLLAMALTVVAGPRGDRGNAGLLKVAWGAFAILSLVFGINLSPFTDPRYLGHQARETFTHALTSVPLAVAACGYLAERIRPAGPWRNSRRTVVALPCFSRMAAAGFLILAAYQAAGALSGGIARHAQTTDPFRLVCTHFFEHTFSLIVVPSHAALLYALAGKRGRE